MIDKAKIAQAVKDGKVTDEQTLKEFILEEKTNEKYQEMMKKIEDIKPTDVSKLEQTVRDLGDKLNEPVVVELDIVD